MAKAVENCEREGRVNERELTIGEAARFLGVSVRTLHHWDSIGLLSPQWRTSTGDYRLYTDSDLEQGQRILIYREAGMPLKTIAELLDATKSLDATGRGTGCEVHSHKTATDIQREHLLRQKELLANQRRRVARMQQAVDKLLDELQDRDTPPDRDTAQDKDMNRNNQDNSKNNKPLTTDEIRDILGDNWDPQYQEEAQQRWGDTDAWKQSQATQESMTKEDWQSTKDNHEQFVEALVRAWEGGVEPGSREANQLAEAHRKTVSQWYECGHNRQVILARMYTQDERFAATYRNHEAYLLEIIEENARHNGVDLDNLAWD